MDLLSPIMPSGQHTNLPPSPYLDLYSNAQWQLAYEKAAINAFGSAIPEIKQKISLKKLYPQTSLFNHSCLPNARVFLKVQQYTQLYIKTLRNITKGHHCLCERCAQDVSNSNEKYITADLDGNPLVWNETNSTIENRYKKLMETRESMRQSNTFELTKQW
ncbi:hypothetical protein I4U23_005929 [Adineta vaga]|nr:hypothetical protein I4U23_005929 [Adineta vaga]